MVWDGIQQLQNIVRRQQLLAEAVETFQFTTALGNGSNFLTIFATGGEVINSISIDASSGFTDLRQVRISGATAPSAVPDTGSTLALLGSGVSALALLRRKLVS